MALLGSAILNPMTLTDLEVQIIPSDFFDPRNAAIWKAIESLHQNGEMIDYLTIDAELLSMGKSIDSQYIASLTERVATAMHARAYAKIVHDLGTRRRIIYACTRIGELAFNMELDLNDEAKPRAQDIFMEATSGNEVTGPQLIKDVVDKYWAFNTREQTEQTRGVTTGFTNSLDFAIRGLKPKQLIVLGGRPGDGKCLGRGTKVLMYNGAIKKVEDVIVGDKLMGPDSLPRTVLSTTAGRDQMYWIRQTHAMDYKVNGAHILSLKRSKNEKLRHNGEVKEISVNEILTMKGSSFFGRWKGYKTAVEFDDRLLPIEPYFLGLWLGDGNTKAPIIYSADDEVAQYLLSFVKKSSMYIASSFEEHDTCARYYIGMHGGKFLSPVKVLKRIGVLGNKHIPRYYLINNRKNRLQLLAGLLDSDGHYTGRSMEITLKIEGLARQVKFLADSLGFQTSIATKKATCQNGYTGVAYRVIISGDLTIIPTRIKRKQATPRKMNKDWRMTGITIEPAGEDDYFGFQLDGDGLFLLEDMTVTHNSTVARQVAAHVARTQMDVAVFSLETAHEEYVNTLPFMLAHVADKSSYTDTEWNRLQETKELIKSMPLFIDDSCPLSVNVLRTKIMQIKRKTDNLGLVIVDYLQLMEGAKQRDDIQDVTQIARDLKLLAMAADVPIMALSAMNRSIESRGDEAEPMLSDLRYGGEADADVVMFIRRKKQSLSEGRAALQTGVLPATIYIKKNRNGPGDAKFPLHFFASQKRFEEAHEAIA